VKGLILEVPYDDSYLRKIGRYFANNLFVHEKDSGIIADAESTITFFTAVYHMLTIIYILFIFKEWQQN